MKKFTALFLAVSILLLSGNMLAKERKGADLIIKKKDGRQVRGELIAVKQNSLLLLDRDKGADVTIDIGDISVIKIEKKSKTLLGIGSGLLLGGGAGFLYGYASECPECHITGCISNAWMWGALIGGAGVLIGGIVGTFTGIDKKIKFVGRSDSEIQEILENLRKKARVKNYQ